MISTDTDPMSVQRALDEVNKIQAQADEVEAEVEAPPTRHPVDGEVKLVGGLLDPTGIIDTATVRELNGRDEEIIVKAPNVAKAMIAILSRGVESIGGEKATNEDIEALLAADRDLLLMKIREVTFGAELEFSLECPFCGESTETAINIAEDIPVKYLDDPVHDRSFTVPLRKGGVAEVRLPTGVTQKNIAAAAGNKSVAELNTLMLYGCVRTINGRDVIDMSQILNLGIADRNKIIEAYDKFQSSGVEVPLFLRQQYNALRTGDRLHAAAVPVAEFPYPTVLQWLHDGQTSRRVGTTRARPSVMDDIAREVERVWGVKQPTYVSKDTEREISYPFRRQVIALAAVGGMAVGIPTAIDVTAKRLELLSGITVKPSGKEEPNASIQWPTERTPPPDVTKWAMLHEHPENLEPLDLEGEAERAARREKRRAVREYKASLVGASA